ncbi:ABC transporter ATP-binding protein [Devosia sp. XK-2]|uniref:ABC transporter ATP-binding protein n=1 Tax=Devosia sp. XK-2 TaxID=3126689 RepID=UPI0030D1A283
MTSTRSMLVLDNVSRRFGSVAALDGVSLEIGAGQIACLVGHSGCGKSTLLRTVAGIETIDGGKILIDGITVSGDDAFVEPEHRRVGFMFQDYALFPHLSVRQNIAFGLSKLPRSDRARRVADIIERIGIGALADRFPHMLSGGEQQRVALARALAPQPRLLLMDEPFSNLDRGLRDKVRHETLAIVRDLAMTAVVVTHDPEEALAIGDMVALMQSGRLVEAGTGERIYDAPWTAYAASFFSQVNVIPARFSPDGLETPLGRFPSPDFRGGAPRVLVRPQSISIAGQGIAAEVLDRAILGEIEQIELKVSGLSAPLIMRGTARHDVAPGQSVHLSINASQVMIFPEKGE